MMAEVLGRPGLGAALSRDQLVSDFRALALRRGQDLIVHSSLRQVGRIDGGAATLLDAILEVAGPVTLVVPTQTTMNSLTSATFRTATAGLDQEERARFIAAMPGFDPATTPSAGMGAFAEYVRTLPSASRSQHPQVSFAAVGPRAQACTAIHDLDCHLGDRSPLGWLYEAQAAILLLGVGYSACTAFHLGEYYLPSAPRRTYQCFGLEAGARVPLEFTDIALDDGDFEALGRDLDRAASQDPDIGMRWGQVGAAAGRLISLPAAVDFARSWLELHRNGGILWRNNISTFYRHTAHVALFQHRRVGGGAHGARQRCL